MTEWSLKDAKDRFGEVVAAAHDSPQVVTQDGKPAVVVVDADEFQRLAKKKLPQEKLVKDGKEYTFIDHLLAFPSGGPEDLFEPRHPERRDFEI
jgi:antitoxin Phd